MLQLTLVRHWLSPVLLTALTLDVLLRGRLLVKDVAYGLLLILVMSNIVFHFHDAIIV